MSPTPHPHAALIIEWAKDTSREVQYFHSVEEGWLRCPANQLGWHEQTHYRFKPEILRYRVALRASAVSAREAPCALQDAPFIEDESGAGINGFIRWLGPVQEVELS